MVRVLTGKPLKFTVRIYKNSGEVVEFQTNDKPKPEFNAEDRCLWIECGYDNPVMRYEPGMVMLTEENPK